MAAHSDPVEELEAALAAAPLSPPPPRPALTLRLRLSAPPQPPPAPAEAAPQKEEQRRRRRRTTLAEGRERRVVKRNVLYGEVQELSEEFQRCLAIVDGLLRTDDMAPFYAPVDAVALGLPTYHDVVKTPMDLGTVKANILAGRYGSSRAFADDMRLMFRNALAFNPAGSFVHDVAATYLRHFEAAYESQVAAYVRTHMRRATCAAAVRLHTKLLRAVTAAAPPAKRPASAPTTTTTTAPVAPPPAAAVTTVVVEEQQQQQQHEQEEEEQEEEPEEQAVSPFMQRAVSPAAAGTQGQQKEKEEEEKEQEEKGGPPRILCCESVRDAGTRERVVMRPEMRSTWSLLAARTPPPAATPTPPPPQPPTAAAESDGGAPATPDRDAWSQFRAQTVLREQREQLRARSLEEKRAMLAAAERARAARLAQLAEEARAAREAAEQARAAERAAEQERLARERAALRERVAAAAEDAGGGVGDDAGETEMYAALQRDARAGGSLLQLDSTLLLDDLQPPPSSSSSS